MALEAQAGRELMTALRETAVRGGAAEGVPLKYEVAFIVTRHGLIILDEALAETGFYRPVLSTD